MIFNKLRADIRACLQRDPAARSAFEVVLLYPGFHALQLHRFSAFLWTNGLRFLGRFVSQFGRFVTGVEIHPAARIGSGVFIDHAMGVVIGETAEIGDNVTLYHGVTLGGIAPSVDSAAQANRKRHPTLKNNVIVGSGAQILGPITVGEGARVGSNAVVLRDVEPHTTVVGIPAQPLVARAADEDRFAAYGTPSNLPDPVQRSVDLLNEKIAMLTRRIEELEREKQGSAKAPAEASVEELPIKTRAGGA